eukprot:6464680-Amphidinium_carterae.2
MTTFHVTNVTLSTTKQRLKPKHAGGYNCSDEPQLCKKTRCTSFCRAHTKAPTGHSEESSWVSSLMLCCSSSTRTSLRWRHAGHDHINQESNSCLPFAVCKDTWAITVLMQQDAVHTGAPNARNPPSSHRR